MRMYPSRGTGPCDIEPEVTGSCGERCDNRPEVKGIKGYNKEI